MNQKSLIIIIATILICLFLSISFLVPSLLNIQKNRTDNQKVTDNLNEITQKNTLLETLSEGNQITELDQIAQAYIPSQKNDSALQNGISSFATLSNTQITDFAFLNNQNSPSATIEEQKFSATVSGSLTQILDFISKLTNANQLTTLSLMDFTQTDNRFILKFTGSAYSRPITSKNETNEMNANDYFSAINFFNNLK